MRQEWPAASYERGQGQAVYIRRAYESYIITGCKVAWEKGRHGRGE
jgi:hypothetical protein